MRDSHHSEDESLYQGQLIASSVLIGLLLILDILLFYLFHKLTKQWRRVSDRNNIRSGNNLK